MGWMRTRVTSPRGTPTPRKSKSGSKTILNLTTVVTPSLPNPPEGDTMTAKANQVDHKIDDVLAKVDKAADGAIAALEKGTNELLGGLDEADRFGQTLGSIGRKLRQRLGSQTNNPPVDDEA
jgi:hypothetical protein